MKDRIVILENLSKFLIMMKSMVSKSARDALIALVYGRYGSGKSTDIEYYVAHFPSFYVRAFAAWSLCMMLEDCLRAYRVEPRGRMKQDLRELVRVMKKHGVPFIIDEADRVVRKTILIETIRDIADLTKVPVILVGQNEIYSSLQRSNLGNFFSRVSEILEFTPLSVNDISMIARELCDLKCNQEAATLIRTLTLGDFRLVNTLLQKLEELCHLNAKNEITIGMIKEVARRLPNLEDLKAMAEYREQKPLAEAATA